MQVLELCSEPTTEKTSGPPMEERVWKADATPSVAPPRFGREGLLVWVPFPGAVLTVQPGLAWE